MIRKFSKKYKFEANLPFEVRKSITLKNVWYSNFTLQNEFLLQIKIKNLSVNKIFMDKVMFLCSNVQQMKAIDINFHDDPVEGPLSIFSDTVVFNPGEVRQYLFMIQMKEPTFKINKLEVVSYLY